MPWPRHVLSLSYLCVSNCPDLTPRALLIGLLVGCLLCFTNLYFGLQTGWISIMSLQSALIGFLVSRTLPTPLSPQENVVVQTTAGAVGAMPLAAGFVGIIPALGLLDPEKDGAEPIHLSWLGSVGWSCAVAYFGVLMSPPLRKQVIIDEQLAFPSGTATAQLISVLHKLPPATDPITTARRRKGYSALETDDGAGAVGSESESESDSEHDARPRMDGVRDGSRARRAREVVGGEVVEGADAGRAMRAEGWPILAWSFAASGALTLFAYFFPVAFSIPLFGEYVAREWLFTFSPSLSYVGQGIIMGFPTALSMNLGMLAGWAILSPLSKSLGWAPGPVGDMSTGARGWILWTSLAIMCADSVVSLLPVAWDSLSSLLRHAYRRKHKRVDFDARDDQADDEVDTETETADRLVPGKWVVWGLLACGLSGTLIVWGVFGQEGIKPWATFVGFCMGGLLSIFGVRALGETDLNPVSGLGKISQLLFAVIQPGNVVANIVAGGVAEAGAMQAGELMQDLKTGHLVHASPRAQFYGQLAGSTLSVFVTVTAFSLYARAYPIPGPSFPAPTAWVWLSLARLLRNGDLPPHSGTSMLISFALFALLSALKTTLSRRGDPRASLIPSGVAFAIGFLNTPSFSIARLMGGVVELAYRRWRRARAAEDGKAGGRRRKEGEGEGNDIRLVVVASGFVLGEGVVSVAALVLRTWGVGVASCWGCGHGLCGGCPA